MHCVRLADRPDLALMVVLKMHAGGAVGWSANTRSCRRRWVQNECRGLGEADAPEVDPVLQRATAALRARPVLLRYCAEEVPGALHSLPSVCIDIGPASVVRGRDRHRQS